MRSDASRGLILHTEAHHFVRPLFALVTCFLTIGCGPYLSVHRLSEDKSGIPFYMPRPYLLIAKNLIPIPTDTKTAPDATKAPTPPPPSGTTKKSGGTTGSGTSNARQSATTPPTKNGPDTVVNQTFYTYQVVYLPDPCQKFGVKIHPGIGTLDTTLNFADGWQFTGTNVKSDTTTAQIITALGTPLQALAGLAGDVLKSGAGVAAKAAAARTATEEKPAPEPPEPKGDLYLYDLFTGYCVMSWSSSGAPLCGPKVPSAVVGTPGGWWMRRLECPDDQPKPK